MFQALDATSEPVVGPAAARLLVIPVQDAAGRVEGGLWGHTQFQWLHIQMLLVPAAMRGQGIGSALMAAAEAEAHQRNCLGIYLDSFSFQAPVFYAKLGFTVFGVLDNFPPGHQRLYFQKRLDPPEVIRR